jgi:hypothetical protein
MRGETNWKKKKRSKKESEAFRSENGNDEVLDGEYRHYNCR